MSSDEDGEKGGFGQASHLELAYRQTPITGGEESFPLQESKREETLNFLFFIYF